MTGSLPQVLISVSQRASGNGVYFYNGIFRELGMPAVYLSCPTMSLQGMRETFRFMGLHAASVAAPFKFGVIDLIDELTPVARETASVNAVRRDGERLIGHNTDVEGITAVLQQAALRKGADIVIYGSGGVVPSAVHAVRVLDPSARVSLAARNAAVGMALARRLGVAWLEDSRKQHADVWMNATPQSLETPEAALHASGNAEVVFDFVAQQAPYPFEKAVRDRGQRFLRGFDFYRAQFLAQFNFYFSRHIEPGLFDTLAAARLPR
jgi:shikimate dehydrogenase